MNGADEWDTALFRNVQINRYNVGINLKRLYNVEKDIKRNQRSIVKLITLYFTIVVILLLVILLYEVSMYTNVNNIIEFVNEIDQ